MTKIKQMITASEVAQIWNERAKKEGKEAVYTRFSVYAQRDKLGGIDTKLGRLFDRSIVEKFDLPRYNPRPDTAKRNRDNFTGKKRDKKTHQFLESEETE